jgi:hypothetical protein
MSDLTLTPALPLPQAKWNRFDPWPRVPWQKTLWQVSLMLPFLAVAIITEMTGYAGFSPNREIVKAASTINFGDNNLSWIADLFPLIPMIIASLFKSALALSLAGAVITGWFLHAVIEAMQQKRIPPWLQLFFILALALNPIMFYNATQNFSMFLAMSAFGVGVIHMVRFIEWGSTYDGFQAGGLFALAALSDSHGILYILMAALTIPLLKWYRKGQNGAGYSTLVVLLFPAFSAIFSIIIVSWLVTGANPIEVLEGVVGSLVEDVNNRSAIEWDSWMLAIFAVPVTLVWFFTRMLRRPGAIIAMLAIAAVQLSTVYYGIAGASSTGISYLILTTLALAMLSQHRTAALNITAGVAAQIQICLTWILAGQSNVLGPWMKYIFNLFS